MKWIELTINTSEEASDAVSGLLLEKGANGTEVVDPYAFRQVLESNRYLDYADNGLIESYGNDVTVKAWFSDDVDKEALINDIQASLKELSQYMNIGSGEIKTVLRDDREWKDTWKQYFKPFKFTEKIVVKPSWEEYEPKGDEIVIELDPGTAFGTGTHETTRMCALLGEKHLKKGDKVLDLGCGTAILALSAVKLGASHALAVDIDDAACKAARLNVEMNGESSRIEVRKGELKSISRETFDLIFVNIIADIILEVSADIKYYTKNNTRVILSGIIKSRRDEVIEAYKAQGFTLVEEMTQGEWVAVVFSA